MTSKTAFILFAAGYVSLVIALWGALLRFGITVSRYCPCDKCKRRRGETG